MTDRMSLALAQADPEVAAALDHETLRQHEGLEMIASENFVSEAVLEAAGSIFTNKYAEGYPGRRYYGGCEYADVVENLARDRAKQIFGGEHVNVQPHSGSQANAAAYAAVLQPGDTILGLDLAHGGHLTHGHRLSFSGKLYRPTFYHVRKDTETIDYDEMEAIAERKSPRPSSAGQRLSAPVGLRAHAPDCRQGGRGLHLRHGAYRRAGGGRRSSFARAACAHHHHHHAQNAARPARGLIICGQELAAAVDKAVFPGQQGGPLVHIVAAKAVALAEALAAGVSRLCGADRGQCQGPGRGTASAAGFRFVSGGTDNHLLLVDVFEKGILGSEAELALGKAGITVNKNAIPYDTNPPLKPSGIRVGTPALTTPRHEGAGDAHDCRVDCEGSGTAQRRCGAGADSRRGGGAGQPIPALCMASRAGSQATPMSPTWIERLG
jgi:glycine hydroxymethyltransferase